jgi:hypothetical protein
MNHSPGRPRPPHLSLSPLGGSRYNSGLGKSARDGAPAFDLARLFRFVLG